MFISSLRIVVTIIKYFVLPGCVEFDVDYFGNDLYINPGIQTWQECGENKCSYFLTELKKS